MHNSAMRWILGLIAIGMAAAISLNYWAPFRWISEVQISQFGIYQPGVSFLVILLLIVLPATWLGMWLDARMGAERHEKMRALIYPLARMVYRADLMLAPIRKHRWLIPVAIGVLLTGVGFGWKLYVEALGHTPISTIHAADVLNGQYRAEGYIRLTNASILQQPAYKFVEKRRTLGIDTSTETTFLPVVTRGQQHHRPIVLFAAIRTTDSSEYPQEEFIGELVRHGLPGPIRERVQGQHGLAKEHFVLHVRQPPTDVARNSVVLMQLGVLALVVGVLWGAVATMLMSLRRKH